MADASDIPVSFWMGKLIQQLTAGDGLHVGFLLVGTGAPVGQQICLNVTQIGS